MFPFFVAHYNRVNCKKSINQQGSRQVHLNAPSSAFGEHILGQVIKVTRSKKVKMKVFSLGGVMHVFSPVFRQKRDKMTLKHFWSGLNRTKCENMGNS